MTRLKHVNTLLFKMNMIGIHRKIFEIFSIEEEQKINLFKLRPFNKVRIQTPCAPPVTYIQYGMTIHGFDRAMVNVSIGLAHYLIMDRLI